jgi:hypothetical protein
VAHSAGSRKRRTLRLHDDLDLYGQVSVSAMKSSTAPRLQVGKTRRGFTWVDGVVMLALLTVFWSALHFGKGMLAHFDASGQPAIDP